jgi:hypothetical protein
MFPENRRFVDVIVRNRQRFEALRDFTVDGALEELDRVNKERKDAGEPTGIRSPARNASLDSARATRSPALGNVPEDSAFAIGEDEDDEDESNATVARPASASTDATDDALPLQSRSMSEKARGKQPIGQTSFSRDTSRTTSTTSLHTLGTNTFSTNTGSITPARFSSNTPSITPVAFSSNSPFTPTAEWVSVHLASSPSQNRACIADVRYASCIPGYRI